MEGSSSVMPQYDIMSDRNFSKQAVHDDFSEGENAFEISIRNPRRSFDDIPVDSVRDSPHITVSMPP
jgi:hypothetical protein